MKHIRRWTTLLIAVMLVAAAFSGAALAEQNEKSRRRVTTLSTGTWLTSGSGNTIYKLTLRKESFVTMNYKNNRQGEDEYVWLYLDSSATDSVIGFPAG